MKPLTKLVEIGCLLLLTNPLWALSPTQSPADPRHYQWLQLDNGLQVLLISDPNTQRAAASLDVKVGSTADPKGFEGLAHFLEHMLFLGTDRYPQAGEYAQFISEQGGEHNAFTSSEHTNYFFSLPPAALSGALDRFSRFFIAPTFDAQFVERERNAVDSEYRLKLKSDERRLDQLLKTTGNPAHPYNRLSVGNLSTLTDRPKQPLMTELKKLYRQYYQASNMKLVVLGAEPLPQLETLVRDRFQQVSNEPVIRPVTRSPLLNAEQQGLLIEAKAVGQARKLELNFSLPSLRPWQSDRPELYLAHVLGHEAAGSLDSYLKQQGWATSLSAGLSLDLDDSAQFSLDISLTPEGAKAYQQVAAACFAYLDLLRAKQPEYFFTELQRMLQLEFQYQEQSQPVNLVVQLAQNLHDYPASQVLSGPYSLRRFRPDTVRQLLGYMTAERVRLLLVRPEFEAKQQEGWYQTPYRVTKLSAAELDALQQGSVAQLALPKANPYLPELQSTTAQLKTDPAKTAQLDTEPAKTRPAKAELPKVSQADLQTLSNEPRLQLWHQSQTPFALPKAEIRLLLSSQLANQTAEQGTRAHLWAEYVQYRLNEILYLSNLAGINASFRKAANGFQLSLSGFSSRQPQLLQQIIEQLQKPIQDPELVARLSGKLERRWQNLLQASPPIQLAGMELHNLIQGPGWPVRDYLQYIGRQQLSELEQFRQQILSHSQIQMLVVGDLSAETSQKLGQSLRQQLDNQAPQPQKMADYQLTPGLKVRDLQAKHQDAALLWYLQHPNPGLQAQAVSAVIGQLLQPAYYHELRTLQQLGYVVNATSFNLTELGGLYLMVQSPSQPADALAAKSEAFVAQFGGQLAKLPVEQLTRVKQGLIAELLQPPVNQAELTDELWDALQTGLGLQHKQALAKAIEAVTPQQLEQGWQQLFGKDSHQLLIRVAGDSKTSQVLQPVPEQRQIQNPSEFRQSLKARYYPAIPALQP